MSFLFKSIDAHTSEIDDTLQYFNAAAGSLDNNDEGATSVPSGPVLGNKKKKMKTNRWHDKLLFDTPALTSLAKLLLSVPLTQLHNRKFYINSIILEYLEYIATSRLFVINK